MSDLTTVNGEVSATVRFPHSFVGFRGHFPGNPVLPGVCLVQAALVMFEAARSHHIRLREIANAKFTQPLAPDAEVRFTGKEQAQDGETTTLKVRVTVGAARVADLSLKVQCAQV